MDASSAPDEEDRGSRAARRFRIAALAALALLLAAALLVPPLRAFIGTVFRLALAGEFAALATYLRSFGSAAIPVVLAAMVVQSLAAPIPPFPITMAAGLVWGPVTGAAVAWTGLQMGSLLCFAVGRTLGRPFVVALFGVRRVGRVDGFFRAFGFRAVLLTRVLPLVSIDLVSFASGVSVLRTRPFMVATGIGLIPSCVVYASAGASLATDPRATLLWIGAFLSILVAAIFVLALRRRRPSRCTMDPARRNPP